MEFSQHALDKSTLCGVNPELVRDGSRARVFEFLLEDDGCFSTSVGLAPCAARRPSPNKPLSLLAPSRPYHHQTPHGLQPRRNRLSMC